MITMIPCRDSRPRLSRGAKLRSAEVALVCLILAILGAAQAQSASSARAKRDVYAELAKVPAKAAARSNPLAADPQAVAAGAKLFNLHCPECHGESANGTRRAPSLRATQVQRAAPGTLFWVLTNGVVRHGMPVWSKLPEPQRWQLVSYIQSLVPASPSESSDSKSVRP